MKYYGQFKPSVDELIHTRYFKDYRHGTCMECGAVDGEWLSSTKFFEEELGWDCINVEAHPVSFEKLKKNRPLATNIHAALSDIVGEITFKFSPKHTLRASIAEENEVRDKNWTYVNVSTTTYSEIIRHYSIGHLDLFVLDVEGNELKVLRNLVECPVLPDILVVEHNAGKKKIIDLIGDLYKYDFSQRVNSYYIKR